MKNYLIEMRMKCWLKNVFVLFPIVFSLELFNKNKFMAVFFLTVAFCLVSSAIYVFNDLLDIEKDRLHKVKKYRPIAAGKVSITGAWILIIVLVIVGLSLAGLVNIASLFMILLYIITNVLYSKWLKHKAILDCFCIATGF